MECNNEHVFSMETIEILNTDQQQTPGSAAIHDEAHKAKRHCIIVSGEKSLSTKNQGYFHNPMQQWKIKRNEDCYGIVLEP